MRVGRIKGFDLSIHWSTLVIFVLLVLSLSTVRLPASAPGYSDAAYLAAAVLTGLAFYASLLAHEVSHALVAQREGIGVSGLTLWVLGGVASLDGEPRTPGADLRIAGAGPGMSLLLAAAFAAVAGLLEIADGPGLVQAIFGWLAGINATLALFNLIPAAPLDGGRILRALLWRARGDRTRAAVAAARAGEAFGYLLVGLGVAQFVFARGVGGVWFMLLGWFVLNAARSERTQTLVRDVLADVTVRDVMTPQPVTAPESVTVRSLLEDYVMRTRHSAFPLVAPDGRPVGLVTLAQVRAVPAERRDEVRAQEVACVLDDLALAAPGDRLLDLLPQLNACGQGRVLVLEGDRLVGILTPTDVARALEVAALDQGVVDLRQRFGSPRRTDPLDVGR